MTDLFSVQFDNLTKCFFPGQQLSGTVHATLPLPGKDSVKAIIIELTGKADVHWKVVLQGTRVPWTTYFRAQENYCHKKINIVGHELTPPDGTRQVACRFKFNLPDKLPSSFVGKRGLVTYQLTATMKYTSWKSFDRKLKIPFTVNGLLDLNAQSRCAEALEDKVFKSVDTIFRSSGQASVVGFNIKIVRRGFVPGELIQFTAQLRNDSHKNVQNLAAYLVQNVTYRAQGKSKRYEYRISKVKGPPLESRERNKIWEGKLRIPPVPPTRLAGCKIIHVDYEVEVVMDIPTLIPCLMSSKTLTKKLPVLIGTIPLRSTFGSFRRRHVTPRTNEFDWSEELELEPPPDYDADSFSLLSDNYPDMPPPTYEDAIASSGRYMGPGIDEQDDDVNENGKKESGRSRVGSIDDTGSTSEGQFVPRYVTYTCDDPELPPYNLN